MTFNLWIERREEMLPRMSDEQEIAKMEALLRVAENFDQLACAARADFGGRLRSVELREGSIYRTGFEGECAVKAHTMKLNFDCATYVLLVEILSDEERLDWSLKLLRATPTKEPIDIQNGDESDTDLGKYLELMYTVALKGDLAEVESRQNQEEGYE